MATWKSYKISDVVNEIDEEKFVLPVIQRRLVWEEEKMELLFDTLLKGDSFGGIMVIEEERGDKPLFNYRPFTKDGSNINSKQVDALPQLQNFVIDGQQRLQTFYIGLKGSINGKVLFFDLFSDYNTEFEFKFENDKDKLPKHSKDNSERVIKDHCWYLASALLKRLKDTNEEDQVAEEIIKAFGITDSIQKKYVEKNVKAFYKNTLTADCLGISKVTVNKSFDEVANKQRIVELFRRLNDGGTKLSPFDLVASILKGFEWQMEAFLDETLREYEDIGLSQDNLIKFIFILQDNHKKEMSAIEAADADFAIKNRDRIKAALKSLKDFLINAHLKNYYKDGNRSFIPLFFIGYHLFHKKISTEDVNNFFTNFDTKNTEHSRIEKWIYHSLINGVFKSKGAGWIPYKTGIRKLSAKMQDYKNKDFPCDELFKVYTDHPIIFTQTYTITNLNELEHSFLYYLIYDRNQTIRVNDIDHIMPKSLLGDLNFEASKINSIKNFQLIDMNTNRGAKNGSPFKEWISNHIADKTAYLKRHLIPTDESLWEEVKFETFSEERGTLVLSKLNSYL
ncbi:MAG: DUF262 domain-containing protein [Chitinophagaceae bacterium]|nr:DUF262 domain-containing protein [Chitinophagaceae bacterium]